MEYDIKCEDCEKCLIDPDNPENANIDKPRRGACTHYVDAKQVPLVANMEVSYKQCTGAVRGKPQIMGEMPEGGPPRSSESREERIERLKLELEEAENYEEKEQEPPLVPAAPQGIDEEKEDLKRQVAQLEANANKPPKKKKTSNKRKKAVKKK